MSGEHECVALEVADEERAFLGLRKKLAPLLEESLEHVSEPHLAIDGLDDIVERLEFFGLAPHFRFALPNLLRSRGHESFESAALGAQLMRSHAHEAEDQRRRADDVQKIGPPGAIPGRKDDEAIDGVCTLMLIDVPCADVELIVAWWEVGVVALGLVGPA